jgi:hypothetical protein
MLNLPRVNRRARTVAWVLGLAGVVACLAAAGVVVAFGARPTFLVGYMVGIVFALLGALVASRAPRRSGVAAAEGDVDEARRLLASGTQALERLGVALDPDDLSELKWLQVRLGRQNLSAAAS